MNLRQKIGKQIKDTRTSRGMSQADLGSLIGNARQYIYHIEKGSKNCSLEKLEDIAEALGVEVEVNLK